MLNETTHVPGPAIFSPPADLVEAMDDRAFRASYMAHHLRAFLADQIRNLRGSRSQKAFGSLIGKPQSVVSRLEDEDYGKVTLQSLIDIAEKLDIALLVRYADFSTFLAVTRDFSQSAVAPPSYSREAMMATPAENPPANSVTRELAASTEPVSQISSGKAWQDFIGRTAHATQNLLEMRGMPSLPSVSLESLWQNETSQKPDPGRLPEVMGKLSNTGAWPGAVGGINETPARKAA